MSVSVSGVLLSITNTSSGANQLTATFANGTQKTLAVQLENPFPIGAIVTSQTVPAANSGWFVCDGANGTVDLRNRFVYGWGAESVGVAAGATSYTTTDAGSHAHGITIDGAFLETNQMPFHSHAPAGNYSGWPDGGGATSGNGYEYLRSTSAVNAKATSAVGSYPYDRPLGLPHNHYADSSTVGNHSHSAGVTPPYVRLYYVQRVT